MTKADYLHKRGNLLRALVAAKLEVQKHPESEYYKSQLVEVEDKLAELENGYKYGSWKSD